MYKFNSQLVACKGHIAHVYSKWTPAFVISGVQIENLNMEICAGILAPSQTCDCVSVGVFNPSNQGGRYVTAGFYPSVC